MENWKLNNIATVTPRLADLEALNDMQRSCLLLRWLVTNQQSLRGIISLYNLRLPAYRDWLMGPLFPQRETERALNLLLGAPWQKLLNFGHLAAEGNGHFRLTEKGISAAQDCASGSVIFDPEVLYVFELLHPKLRHLQHHYSQGKLKEVVAAAFEIYENRLNEIRDGSRKRVVKSSSGVDLPHVLFNNNVLKFPYPKLGTGSKRSAYEKALSGLFSNAIGWIRNAYTHEKHNLPSLQPEEAIELLFFASYLLRMTDNARPSRKK